jgi:hypothetical protein
MESSSFDARGAIVAQGNQSPSSAPATGDTPTCTIGLHSWGRKAALRPTYDIAASVHVRMEATRHSKHNHTETSIRPCPGKKHTTACYGMSVKTFMYREAVAFSRECRQQLAGSLSQKRDACCLASIPTAEFGSFRRITRSQPRRTSIGAKAPLEHQHSLKLGT